jgi:hypothetical protein
MATIPNPFSGIITQELKDLHCNMISSLLLNDGLTTACRLDYGVTRYDDCSNCIFDPIGRKSSGRYQSGGPVPFQFGSRCPVCNGNGRIGHTETEPINLMVIWDYRSWINFDINTQSPAGRVQTMSIMSTLPKLKRARFVTLATDIENHIKHKFQRDSEPEPCGFGEDNFITVLWKRIG